jgi:predicted small secreted protein
MIKSVAKLAAFVLVLSTLAGCGTMRGSFG